MKKLQPDQSTMWTVSHASTFDFDFFFFTHLFTVHVPSFYD